MSTAVATIPGAGITPAQVGGMSPAQVDLITRTIAKDCTPDELQMFLYVCGRTGLDPFARQIYAVKRWDPELGQKVMSIQTGIDGYRLVAERTGRYMPGREPTYTYDAAGSLVSATSYVRKCDSAGVWHEVSATAHYAEYVQKKKDGTPTRFWRVMPHGQTAKCAEALALRRAFPMELSGVYADVEMDQADTPAVEVTEVKRLEPEQHGDARISEPQAKRLFARLKNAGHSVDGFKLWLLAEHNLDHTRDIPRSLYDAIIARVDDTAPFVAPTLQAIVNEMAAARADDDDPEPGSAG